MKSPFVALLPLLMSLMVCGTVLAATDTDSETTSVDSIIELGKTTPSRVLVTPPIETLDPRFKNPVTDGAPLAKADEQNLTSLWRVILTRNPIIEYGLKQLATPPELRYAHESIMSRTIGGLLNGAAMLPLAMGATQYTAGATAIGANAVDRAMVQSQKADPNKLPSDTELVELSGLVQTLQKALVENYFQYKSNLSTCAQMDTLLGKLEDDRLKARGMELFWNREVHETTEHQHLLAQQAAKRAYVALERMVGADGMRTLSFDTPTEAVEKSVKVSSHATKTPKNQAQSE